MVPTTGGGQTDGSRQNPAARLVWVRIASFPERRVGALAAWGGAIVAGCDSGRLFVSYDSTQSWTGATSPASGSGIDAAAFGSAGTVYASGLGLGVLRSTDGGLRWSRLSAGDTLVTALGVFGPGEVAAGTATGGLLVSADSGNSWHEPLSLGRPITCILPSPGPACYLATWGGGVFYTGFGATTVEGRNSGLLNPYLYVVRRGSSGRLMGGTYGGGIFSSTNDGGTWVRWGDSLIGTQVFDVFEQSLRQIVAATSAGPFYSTDAGLRWLRADSGFTAHEAFALVLAPDGALLAGTDRGLYRTLLPRSD